MSVLLSVPVCGFAFAGLSWGLGLSGFGGFMFGACGAYWGAVAGLACATAGIGAVVGIGVSM